VLLQIGTYNAAVLAARHKIAFIVVAPISTVDLEIPDGSQYVLHWSYLANLPTVTNHNLCSIPIEQRPSIEACLVRGAVYPSPLPGSGVTPSQEVVMLTPPNIDLENGIYNPSFDVTPAELITAIVTEKGVAANSGSGFDLSGVV
jgi:methylthioribose-1-phosphate isomerase